MKLFNECFAQCRECPPGIRPDTWQRESGALSNHGLALLASNASEPSLAESYLVQANTAESKIFATLLFLLQDDSLKAQSMFGLLTPQEVNALKKSLPNDASSCALGSWTQRWLQDCSNIIESGLDFELVSNLQDAEPQISRIEDNNSIENRLAKLKDLADQGLITTEEYASKKSKLLDEI